MAANQTQHGQLSQELPSGAERQREDGILDQMLEHVFSLKPDVFWIGVFCRPIKQ